MLNVTFIYVINAIRLTMKKTKCKKTRLIIFQKFFSQATMNEKPASDILLCENLRDTIQWE